MKTRIFCLKKTLFSVCCVYLTLSIHSPYLEAATPSSKKIQNIIFEKTICRPQSYALVKLDPKYVSKNEVTLTKPDQNEANSGDYFRVMTGKKSGLEGTIKDILNDKEISENDTIEAIGRVAYFNSPLSKQEIRIFRDEKGVGSDVHGVAISSDKKMGAVLSNETTSDIVLVDLLTEKTKAIYLRSEHRRSFNHLPEDDQIQFIKDSEGRERYLAFLENYDRNENTGPILHITYYDLKTDQRISISADEIVKLSGLRNQYETYPNAGDTIDRRYYHAINIEKIFNDLNNGQINKTRVVSGGHQLPAWIGMTWLYCPMEAVDSSFARSLPYDGPAPLCENPFNDKCQYPDSLFKDPLSERVRNLILKDKIDNDKKYGPVDKIYDCEDKTGIFYCLATNDGR